MANVTKNLASVMEMVDRKHRIALHKEGGYIQTMKPEEELKMKTIMSSMKVLPALRNFSIFWKESDYYTPVFAENIILDLGVSALTKKNA